MSTAQEALNLVSDSATLPSLQDSSLILISEPLGSPVEPASLRGVNCLMAREHLSEEIG